MILSLFFYRIFTPLREYTIIQFVWFAGNLCAFHWNHSRRTDHWNLHSCNWTRHLGYGILYQLALYFLFVITIGELRFCCLMVGSLEQAKLGKSIPKPLEGRITYITGAASGIGRAIAIVNIVSIRIISKWTNIFFSIFFNLNSCLLKMDRICIWLISMNPCLKN